MARGHRPLLKVSDAAGHQPASWRSSSRRPILLICTARDNLERIIRQRPLQRLGFIPWRAHPCVAFFISRQDRRHRLGMDRPNDGIRRGCQNSAKLFTLNLACGKRGFPKDSLTRHSLERRATEAAGKWRGLLP